MKRDKREIDETKMINYIIIDYC